MRNVTIAATQMACSWDRAANIANAERLVRQAADGGAQIILLQELFETPYFCQDQRGEFFDLAHPADGNPLIEHFAKLAAELEVVLPISFFEREGKAYFNSAAIVDADGSILGVYRKSHIPDGPATPKSSISRRATQASRSGGPVMPRSASGSAGTNGFPNPLAPWRCSARKSSFIRRRSAPSRQHRRWTRPVIGKERCRAVPPPTSCRSSPPTG